MTQQAPFAFDLGEMIGGRRGVIDASVPGVALVIVDTFASLAGAIVVALAAAAVLAVVRAVRREPLRQAAMGLLGLAGAAALAAFTGEAKRYFLPGILINAGYAVLAVASIAAGRPALGYVAAMLDRGYSHWRAHPPLRRAAAMATGMWAAVFALRAIVQGYLYVHGHVHWLAPVRLGMGLPLWALAVAGTLFVLEGHHRPADPDQLGSGSGEAPAS
ncbi:MAG TPA: DUF3159 domain-containing protein [Mycobacteriales bacterium]|nr:DUF3159 domain-containing protein [Mycobacteriales bacterium]